MGEAEIELVGGSIGLPEAVLGIARDTPGVAVASPFIEATFYLRSDESPMHILGLDLTSEGEIREYAVERDSVRVRDPLRLLAKVNSVIISPALASRAGSELGGSLPVRHRDTELQRRLPGSDCQHQLARGRVAEKRVG